MAKSLTSTFERFSKLLIVNFLGFSENDENFERSLDFIMSNLLYHHCLDVNSHSVQKSIQGIAFKMGIHGLERKAEKLLTLTQKFMSAPEHNQEVDIKWAILSLLIELAHQPTKESMSSSISESASNYSDQLQSSAYNDWLGDLREKSFHLPDETLSDWSEDDMVHSLTNASELEESKSSSLHKCELEKNDERQNIQCSLIKNNHLAKSWFANSVHINYWSNDYNWFTEMDSGNKSGGYVTEYAVMRECLWILMCPTNGYIFRRNRNNKIITHSISISTLSKETLQSMLNKVASAANCLHDIDEWTNKKLPTIAKSNASGSRVISAFGDGLIAWRQSLNTLLVQLERRVFAQEEHQTLMWLINKLEPSMQNVAMVGNIIHDSFDPSENIDRQSLRLLSNLTLNVESAMSPSKRECALVLLRNALGYHFVLLQTVLWDRSLEKDVSLHPYGISCKLEKDEKEQRLAKKYDIDHSFIEGLRGLTFITTIQHDLLKIVKLKEITNNLNMHFAKDYISIENVVADRMKKDCLRKDPPTGDVPEIKIDEPTASIVISHETQPSGPLPEMSGADIIADPFLRKSFELDRDIIIPLENQVRKLDVAVVDIPNIERLLCDSLLPIVHERYEQLGRELMAFLRNQHKLPSQMSAFKAIVLMLAGDIMLEFYSCLFSKINFKEDFDDLCLTQHLQYCISLKYPKLSEKFYISMAKQENAVKFSNSNLSLLSIHFDEEEPFDDSNTPLPLPHRLHRLQLLRSWLLYFTGVLHSHFYTSVLVPFSEKVDKLFTEEMHYDNVIKEHGRLLDETLYLCLLQEKSVSPIQKTLFKVFSTVDTLKDLWRGSPDKLTDGKLLALETQYATCHRIMATFFTNLMLPHVEGLAQSLVNSCPA